MAASAEANKITYGQGAVSGSLAYDFDHPELYDEEYSSARTPVAEPAPKTRVRTRARAVVHTRQSIAPSSVAGILAAAFLLVIAITAQAQLVSISSESVALRQELETLAEEQAKLRIRYESAFNMAEIEDYAIHSIGMQRPKADQIYYIDTSAPDKAIVIASAAGDSFVDRVSDFISDIGAYFR